MTTIIIRPKNKAERNLISRLLKKMNIETQIVEEAVPNYETKKAIQDVELQKGTKTENAQDLFSKLGI
jgi:hypothetical protein